MRLPGRLSAAIEVLTDVETRKRPVSEALKAWGLNNRFAGSGDRAGIGNMVYDVLRRRASHAWAMGTDDPRALVLSVAVREWGETVEGLNAAFAGDNFAPAPVTEEEAARLTADDPLAGAPDYVKADIPDWAGPSLDYLGDWVAEGRAMAERPPVDLRVNTLKSTPEKVKKALSRFTPADTFAANGLRMFAGGKDARTPNVQSDEGYIKGWFEVQDLGSQAVSVLAGAKPGEQVLDLCAGGGGKTLAMAADMGNRGQIFAYDSERARLAPIYDRLKRNGVRNVQVRAPEAGALGDLVGKIDRVLIDAPCTGTGTWRRRPDTKWKLSAEQVAVRIGEQAALLVEGATYVKAGGHLVYVTCSLLADENRNQIERFLAEHADFKAVPGETLWSAAFGETAGTPYFGPEGGVTLTPHRTGTDGFYVCVMRRG
ncbi:RsmB/NOP family class I SAM-dependent RNA methyltransferase [Paradevosia shaoguanensis]|uniref:RsmB/NOP family class I SAM-dependent RNA methyltransferase n=1 Tax=Paradevosia shaoguanensis TaxID=1335043 RepID=UPI001932FE43|nr:RsmB/NOP family class I SAM-dependent RNA methyltransferase [Paradevosia shaoguanensis]